MSANDTVLVLTGIGIPEFSARGLTQTLTPIGAAASLRRTVNGDLFDLSQSQFRKYASTITCTDQEAPAIDGIFPGQVVTVECAARLSYLTVTGPQRPVVTGSEIVNGSFTSYRPILEMRVIGIDLNDDEWGASRQWSIQLEEI
jgi:hypothetical protein